MIKLGTANYISFENAPDSRRIVLDPSDPVHVKRVLNLNKISDVLFPSLVTGVRYWPFLLVARVFKQTDNRSKLQKELNKIRRRQLSQRHFFPRLNIGPSKLSTFDNYRRMYQNIEKGTCLFRLINDKRITYSGYAKTFKKYEKVWKRALLSSLPFAKRYANLLKKTIKDTPPGWKSGRLIVEASITEILKHSRRYRGPLLDAAVIYAFLRCMYGIAYEEDGKVEVFFDDALFRKWADLLRKLIASGRESSDTIVRMKKQYGSQIRQVCDTGKPPWEKTAKRVRKDAGHLLASLKFHLFYNLYMRPTPEK